jgi:UDP-N-acetylmuramoyl-tripeptide--D-alanyl-D-alanine ligase
MNKMSIEQIYSYFLKTNRISTDSRDIQKNDFFWALKGDSFNGNNFVKDALQKGALYAISDEKTNQKLKNVILVDNCLETLQKLAQYHRKKIGIKIIALTGTNGKTTTKELIASVLSKKYAVKATQGNFNNHIGVPLTILSFDKNLDFGITEMGANHPGEIKALCEIAEPDFGMITNIGKAHLEGFGSFEGLKNTKKEIYDFLKEKDGVIFYNSDNELLTGLLHKHKKVSYGSHSNADYQVKFISSEPFVKFELRNNKTSEIIQSKLIGSYNFENIAAAVSFGLYFNVPVEFIRSAIENYIPSNNRSQIIKKESSTIISDAYNANPSSVEKALENFKNIPAENKVIILGDMFELGDYAKEEHERIISVLVKKSFENVSIFTAGENFLQAKNKIDRKNRITSFKKTEELIEYIQKYNFRNTWFLMKGSRGMKIESVIEHLKIT